MTPSISRTDIFARLQNEIRSLEGYRAPSDGRRTDFGLGLIESAFPNHTFPMGAVHEFLSDADENAAATSGFLATLLGTVMRKGGYCLWISTRRTLFPPALKFFGVEPHQVIFIDLDREQDLLWAIEESLKCSAVAAVVGEIKEITLTESRRLQLAVEQSRVTGFIHRHKPRQANTLASISRWKITSLPSELEAGMPGVGYPRWNVQLVKVRNGEPGEWQLEWSAGGYRYIQKQAGPVAEKNMLQMG